MTKKINKLVGLKKQEFDLQIELGKISLSESRLIPLLKTGDEMALTSILLSSLRLIKEFKDQFFKQTKLKKGGKVFYYTEVCFHDHDKTSRLDGLILVVVGGVIKDAAFIEVKNGKNILDNVQVIKYYKLAQSLQNVPKIITVSNEYVSDPSNSPIRIKNQSKYISLYHFSWTYLKTIAHLLLFDNDENIRDEDQVELMREVLHYFDDERSGVNGFHRMSQAWKEVADLIKNQQSLNDKQLLEDAIISWYQEETDMALLLSRKLGAIVKTPKENYSKRVDKDVVALKKKHSLSTKLYVKRAVSDLKISADFDRRTVSMSVYVHAPLNKGTIARLTWLKKQLKPIEESELVDYIVIDADVKYTKNSINFKLSQFEEFYEYEGIKSKEIIGFRIDVIKSVKFAQVSGFVKDIEDLLLKYYLIVVQNLKSWEKPAPKIHVEPSSTLVIDQ